MPAIKLSVVIITFNEERNIARCLESVQPIADEIVVIDSFSTDKTEEICRRYPVIFQQRNFTGYVDQKNFADSQATHSCILNLDADEVLTPELTAEIAAIKTDWQLAGYYLKRITNYCGTWVKHGGWYPDKKLRLYNREKGKWEGLLLHEEYKVQPGQPVGYLQNDLLHYSFYSLEDHLKQINNFTTIGATEMKIQGRKTNIFMLLVKPPFKFLKSYFLQLGFLDGFAGFCIAVLSSYAVFVKYAKLYLAK